MSFIQSLGGDRPLGGDTGATSALPLPRGGVGGEEAEAEEEEETNYIKGLLYFALKTKKR